MKPTTCPRTTCRQTFPSRAAFLRHFNAGCCKVPKPHIACSECSPWMGQLKAIAVDFIAQEARADQRAQQPTLGAAHPNHYGGQPIHESDGIVINMVGNEFVPSPRITHCKWCGIKMTRPLKKRPTPVADYEQRMRSARIRNRLKGSGLY